MSYGDSAAEMQVAAIQQLPPDMAILKLENENIMSLAAARPRDHKKIKAEIVEQMEAYPSFAAAAIYSKPVGRDNDKCAKCGAELYRQQGRDAERCYKCGCTDIIRGQMKYARNLSVRAAEAIAEAYGYNRVRCDVTPVGDDAVKVEATFTDYQKGRIWQSASLVSRLFKKRNGQMERMNEDRFYNVVVKSEQSKCIREAITRSVPPGLRSELFEMAEKRLAKLLDEPTVNKIVAKFASRGVTLEMIEARIGRTRKMGWTEQDRLDLLGIWNAIEDGETTVGEAFANEPPQPQAEEKKPQTGATAGDLTGETEPEQKKPEEPKQPAAETAPQAEKPKRGRPKREATPKAETPAPQPPAEPEAEDPEFDELLSQVPMAAVVEDFDFLEQQAGGMDLSEKQKLRLREAIRVRRAEIEAASAPTGDRELFTDED